MIDTLKPLIKQFLPFAQERMGFENPPRLFLKQDSQNAGDPLGKTAYYDPAAVSVTLYVTNRHPKDIMRSLSHELVHHTQNCNGQFNDAGEMGEGYAQNNEHMREMERQAYEMGNICFRDWEDSIKSTIYFEHLQKGVNNSMSTKEWKNGEINALLTEKWGFSFNLDALNEAGDMPSAGGSHTGGTGDRPTEEEAEEETAGKKGADSKREEEGLDEAGTATSGFRADPRPRQPHRGEREEDPCDPSMDPTCAPEPGPESMKKQIAKRMGTGTNESTIQEDSGEEEGRHYSDDSMSDEDHIKAIRHHLEALEGDRDYDEGHEELEEGGAADRKDPRNRRETERTRPMQEAQLRKLVREALKQVTIVKSKKGR